MCESTRPLSFLSFVYMPTMMVCTVGVSLNDVTETSKKAVLTIKGVATCQQLSGT